MELRSGALSSNEFWCKIPDCAGPGTQKRPFDAFFTAVDLTIALEAKFWYTDRSATFDLREFKEHQIEALTEIDGRRNWIGAGAIRWTSSDRKPRAVVIAVKHLTDLMSACNRVNEARLLGECTKEEIQPFVQLNRLQGDGIIWDITCPIVMNFNDWDLLSDDKSSC